MDAPHTIARSTRRLAGVAIVIACTLAAMLAARPADAAAAGTVTAIDSASAQPSSFVPDWDGHTDLTVLSYRLVQRSVVTIRVLDRRGRIVATFSAGIQESGVQHATWDGRRRDGRLMPPGAYRLRVDARPVRAAAGEPDNASLGGATVTPGARAATVVLQRPRVALTSVQLSRTEIGKAKGSTSAQARFRLSAAASISAAVVDGNGRVVRTLVTGRRRAGTGAVAWNGRTASGLYARDGEYALVVAATGGGRPTATTRLPLTVDRVVPRMRTAGATKAGVSGSVVRIPLKVTASEPGTLLVRFGRRTATQSVAAGTHTVQVDGSQLGLVALKSARSVRLTVLLRDGAGNTNGRRVTVTVPARTQVVSTPPTTTTNPAIPTPVGKWPWPVDGIVTSEFGLRDGRPHEGIDIAVPTGTPIHPVATGTVAFVGSYGGYGNLVIVDHGNGLTTRYAHMSRFGSFPVGSTVQHTDVIGFVGCTGHCTGPHVHFETRVADTARNPRAFLVAR